MSRQLRNGENNMRIVKLTKESKSNILENLLKRSPNSYGKFESAVADILEILIRQILILQILL